MKDTSLMTASSLEAARNYVRRGWCVVPVPFKQKRPVIKGWEQLRLAESDLDVYFDQPANLGLILGEPSGGLVDVDLDCAEARELADKYLPATTAKTGREGSENSHWWYIAAGASTVQHRDPVTKQMIVELRSTGGQTVVGPSIHPSGESYDVLSGEPTVVPAEMLTACVVALANRVIEIRHGEKTKDPKPVRVTEPIPSPLSASEIEQRALAYLDKMPAAISGNGGHAATYAAATVLVHGFEIDPEQALTLLQEHYNPHCDPPWTEKELRHKVNSAATKPHDQPRGWLLNEPFDRPIDPDVDITQLVDQAVEKTGTQTAPTVIATDDDDSQSPDSADPGPLPDELLRIPGFVSEVIDVSLENAPYPNLPLAFCGAVALQAFLGGRKVRDPADNRTNLYLLALAYASSGKDFARKLNATVLHTLGMAKSVGESLASGEGLEDGLERTPCLLLQTDEIDSLLQSINKSRDARHEIILGTLLKMFSSSNSFFPMRLKAGQESKTIEQPCLVLYGTAIPNLYYSALTERLLTNGFFARTIVVDASTRGEGQEPGICQPTPRIKETATYWANFNPGKGNLQEFFPIPKIVPYTDDAKKLIIESRRACEAEYSLAESNGDPVGTTVWGRTNEHVRKLALIYAISANHREPLIDSSAVRWASEFMMHQTRRMLFMADGHVAENPFHAQCLKAKQKLRDAPDRTLAHSVLLKRMKLDAQSFMRMMETLIAQGDVVPAKEPTAGRPFRGYQLVVGA